MKEYIERAAVKNLLDRYGGTDDALALIDTIPASDVAEVVRCRECRWYDAGKNDSESWSDCTLRYGKHFNVSPMDFCSYGQRKEADHEVSE